MRPDANRRRRTGQSIHAYEGNKSRTNLLKPKYAECERVTVCGADIRKLTPGEIDEWHDRMQRIMNPGYVVVEVKTRKAVV